MPIFLVVFTVIYLSVSLAVNFRFILPTDKAVNVIVLLVVLIVAVPTEESEVDKTEKSA